LEVVSTVGGLAFAPKGMRLAITHYNGATLWFPNAKANPETLEWKGSHLGVQFSPDGRFLVTSMQESMLHGWRLDDRKDMRMSGYAARVRSMSWTADGKWLATSGSNQVVLWPFQGKDGPMGKQPQLRAPSEHQAEVVACHPKEGVLRSGSPMVVLLVRTDDSAEILAKRPGDATITALA
jgi:WD40 repeat protein